MSGSGLAGVVLILVGAMDVLVGMLVVVPRAGEQARPILRLAFALGALVMIVLGTLFLTGVLGG